MAGSIYDWSLTPGSNDDSDGDIDWREGQFPDTVNDSARQMMGRNAEWRDDITGALSAGGTANARTLTARSAFTSLTNGRMVTFRSGLANTGATTINVNSLGSKAIRKMGISGDVELEAGDLLVNGVYQLIYSTTGNANAGGWLLLAPYTNAYATLTATTAVIGIGAYGSYNGAPISTLTGGTTAGALIEGGTAGHLVLGIRDNDATDSVSIVSYNGTSSYSKLVAAFRANGASMLDAVTASSLAVSGAVTLIGGATLNGNKIDAFPIGTRMLFQQTAAPTGWAKDTTHNNKALRLVSGTVTTGGSVAFTTAFSAATTTTSVTQSGSVGNTTLTVAQMPNHLHGPGTLAGTAASAGAHAHAPGTLTGLAASAGAHTHGPGSLTGVTNSAGAHTHPNLGDGYLFNTSGGLTSTVAGNNASIGTIPSAGAHTHSVDVNAGATASGGAHTHVVDVNAGTTASGGAHTHTVDVNAGTTNSAGSGGSHTHAFTGDPHAHTTNLAVQYVDFIICEKAS